MTEVNKSFHFYIRVSADFLFLSGIWCITNVVFRAIIRSGLLLDNLKAETPTFPYPSPLFIFPLYFYDMFLR